MDKRLIWPFRWLTKKLLTGIPIGKEDADRIQALAGTSAIIFVHQSRSVVHHLALSQSLRRSNLQPPWKIMGIASGFLSSWWNIVAPGKTKPKQEEIVEELNHGTPVGLFLKHPRTLFSNPNKDTFDYIRSIIELRQEVHKPIKLVPLLFVPRVNPKKNIENPGQLIFGTNREPGFLRALIRFVTASNSARWEMGDVLDLDEEVARLPEDKQYDACSTLREILNSQIGRLESQYCGPTLKSAAKMEEDTLNESALVRYIDKLSNQTGVLREKNHRRAQKYFREIAAKFDIDAVRFLDVVIKLLKRRIYAGLEWEAKDIEKIRVAARKGPLVFMPSHRSHMDYLLVSYALYQEGIMPPYIAAGDNLSFFPMGSLFRRGGAYFIRRSFKGDPLYPQVVKAYISRLFKEGYGQEFFIEGTRSRSGKTLWPKFGLLSIMVDALSEADAPNAQFIPASVSYEKLLEGGEYEKELRGGAKTRESNKELLKSSSVLKKKYGKVYLSFDEPISFKDFIENKGLTKKEINQDPEKLNEISQSLGYQIAYGISGSFIVTPTALIITALFGSHRRMLSEDGLNKALHKIVKDLKMLHGASIRLSSDLYDEDALSYKRSLNMLVSDGSIVSEKLHKQTYYRIDDQAALKLDFHKNTMIHHFVPQAILATAYLSLEKYGDIITEASLLENTKILSDIFRFEFVYPPGVSFSETFEKYLQYALEKKILLRSENGLKLAQKSGSLAKLKFAVRMIANFVDAYGFIFTRVNQIAAEKKPKKDLIQEVINAIKEGHLSGMIEHPESANKAIATSIVQYLIHRKVLVPDDLRGKSYTLDPSVGLDMEKEVLMQAHYSRVMN